jgi:hypothetical protein
MIVVVALGIASTVGLLTSNALSVTSCEHRA